MGKLFGTDGIRGEANRYPMNAEMAFKVGQAVTYLLRKEHHRTRIIIGKDTRISGYMLESSLEAGISSMGGNPYLVGVLPTPGIAFIANSMRADAGIVISASHNPYEDNGIKIFGGNGFKLSDEKENTIEDLMLGGKLAELLPHAKEMGQAYRMEDVERTIRRFPEKHLPARFFHGRDEDSHGHGQRGNVQGRAGGIHRARCRSGCHPQYAQWIEHQ